MSLDSNAGALVLLGIVFLAGLAADVLGRRTHLPRVTLLLLIGVAVGPLGFDAIPAASTQWFPFIANMALVMVAFLLGGELTVRNLREHGRSVLVVSLIVVGVTAAVVALGLSALGWPIPVALLLGAIATSTDPIAVSDVVHETGSRGPFTKVLLGVVAVDDAWGIAAMSLALALIVGFEHPADAGIELGRGLLELGGAVAVGCVLGVPMAFLSGRVRTGEPTQAEALGSVLLCGGVALWFEVSLLLAAMTMGAVVANLARHHRRSFLAIEGIEWPFMILFFVLSGASIAASELGPAAALIAAYVSLRLLGRLLGGWVSGLAVGSKGPLRHVGFALLPQAGVAIGMALVASQQLPEMGDALLTATVAGTILFEMVGPVSTRLAIMRADEANAS